MVVNCHLKRSVVIQNALHGFKTGRAEGKATLEAKIDQQLTGLACEPLFQVFLYVRKVYNLLDWEWCQ